MLDKALTELNVSNSKTASHEEKIKEYSEYIITIKEQHLLLEKRIDEGLAGEERAESTI